MNVERQKFLERRRGSIGGSDLAAICGVSRFKTPYDVWLDKRGEGQETDPDNQFIYWGNVLEDVVAREYSIRTGQKIQRVNAQMVHPDAPFLHANIDRAVVNPDIAGRVAWKDGRLTTDRILECKTANGFAAALWGDEGTDAVPDEYFIQCQLYMSITQADHADVAVLIGGNDYRVYHIERNEALMADLMAEAEAFWKLVQDGIAPDPQSIADAQKRWPKHIASKQAVATTAAVLAVEELNTIKDQMKALEAREDALKLQIMEEMKDAEVLTDMGDPLVTWKAQSADRIDTKALRKDHPNIATLYTKTTHSRVMRLKSKKD